MDDIRKSFRENEVTRIFWKRCLAVATVVFSFSFLLVGTLVMFTAYADTMKLKTAIAEKFMEDGTVTQEWLDESFSNYIVLESYLKPCEKASVKITEIKNWGEVCNGTEQLDFLLSINWKEVVSTFDIFLMSVASLAIVALTIWSDRKWFVEKGQFYNFDGQILGTKLNGAYKALIKDIEDLESDDFENLAEKLYFLLKQDVWIQNRDKQFYLKVTNEVLKSCDKHLLYEEGESFFLYQKSLEREIHLKRRERWKYAKSLLSLVVSRHFTSAFQLLIFALSFALVNSAALGMLVDSDNPVVNYHDTVSILTNLWASVNYQSDAGYIFGIYLQIIGIVLFGIFVNVLSKGIKR